MTSPFVYDSEESFLEMLRKFYKYLHELTGVSKQMADDIDELRKLFNNSLKNVKNFVASEEIIFLVKSIGVDGNFTLDISFWVTFSNEKEFIHSVSDVMILVKKISVDNKFNIINTVWISDEDNNSSAGMYGNV